MAGLVGSPHCVGMCGGFAIACGTKGAKVLPWHIGRLCTYGVLGAVAGALGSAIPGPRGIGAVISAALVIWFAAALAGVVPEPRVTIPGLSRLAAGLANRNSGLARFGFGLANGLLPCGLVYAALSIPVATGNPLYGAVTMMVFGAGTVPALTLLVVGARRLVLRSLGARRALAAGVLIAGLWSVATRQGLLPQLTGGHDTHETELRP